MLKKKPWWVSINIKIIEEKGIWFLLGRSAVEAFEFFTEAFVTSKHSNPRHTFSARLMVLELLRCNPATSNPPLFQWVESILSCKMTDFSSITFNLSTYFFRMVFAFLLSNGDIRFYRYINIYQIYIYIKLYTYIYMKL